MRVLLTPQMYSSVLMQAIDEYTLQLRVAPNSFLTSPILFLTNCLWLNQAAGERECTANLWSRLAKSSLIKYTSGRWRHNDNDPVFDYSIEQFDCIKGSTLWFFPFCICWFLMNLPSAYEIRIHMLCWMLLFLCSSPREHAAERACLLSAACRWQSCSGVCCSEDSSGNISLSESWWKSCILTVILPPWMCCLSCAEFSGNLRKLILYRTWGWYMIPATLWMGNCMSSPRVGCKLGFAS